MRPGFWDNPEGDDAKTNVIPMAVDTDVSLDLDLSSLTASGTIRALATKDSAELLAECPQTAALLPMLVEALGSQTTDADTKTFDVSGHNEDELNLLSQIMGEGEVSLIVTGSEGHVTQAQESVMAGLWRVRMTDEAGRIIRDTVEVGSVPQAVFDSIEMHTVADFTIGDAPDGAMNVMPVLSEIRDKKSNWKPGDSPEVINFTLFPMSEVDMSFLKQTLGMGPVQIMSRGYGTCRIVTTTVRHVWSVQYFNAMDTPILDTLEICDVPEAARAATEDFEDSSERLKEIREAYFT